MALSRVDNGGSGMSMLNHDSDDHGADHGGGGGGRAIVSFVGPSGSSPSLLDGSSPSLEETAVTIPAFAAPPSSALRVDEGGSASSSTSSPPPPPQSPFFLLTSPGQGTVEDPPTTTTTGAAGGNRDAVAPTPVRSGATEESSAGRNHNDRNEGASGAETTPPPPLYPFLLFSDYGTSARSDSNDGGFRRSMVEPVAPPPPPVSRAHSHPGPSSVDLTTTGTTDETTTHLLLGGGPISSIGSPTPASSSVQDLLSWQPPPRDFYSDPSPSADRNNRDSAPPRSPFERSPVEMILEGVVFPPPPPLPHSDAAVDHNVTVDDDDDDEEDDDDYHLSPRLNLLRRRREETGSLLSSPLPPPIPPPPSATAAAATSAFDYARIGTLADEDTLQRARHSVFGAAETNHQLSQARRRRPHHQLQTRLNFNGDDDDDQADEDDEDEGVAFYIRRTHQDLHVYHPMLDDDDDDEERRLDGGGSQRRHNSRSDIGTAESYFATANRPQGVDAADSGSSSNNNGEVGRRPHRTDTATQRGRNQRLVPLDEDGFFVDDEESLSADGNHHRQNFRPNIGTAESYFASSNRSQVVGAPSSVSNRIVDRDDGERGQSRRRVAGSEGETAGISHSLDEDGFIVDALNRQIDRAREIRDDDDDEENEDDRNRNSDSDDIARNNTSRRAAETDSDGDDDNDIERSRRAPRRTVSGDEVTPASVGIPLLPTLFAPGSTSDSFSGRLASNSSGRWVGLPPMQTCRRGGGLLFVPAEFTGTIGRESGRSAMLLAVGGETSRQASRLGDVTRTIEYMDMGGHSQSSFTLPCWHSLSQSEAIASGWQREDFSAVTVDTRVIVMGGRIQSGATPFALSSVECWDISELGVGGGEDSSGHDDAPTIGRSAAWHGLPPMTVARYAFGAAVVRLDNAVENDEDEDGDTSMLDASRRRRRRRGQANTVVVVSGGFGSDGESLDSVEYFNFANHRWRSLPSMSRKRGSCAAVGVSNGRLMVFGGCSGSDGDINREYWDSAEVYDFETNSWSEMRSRMAVPRAGFAAVPVSIGGGEVMTAQFVVVLGGHNESCEAMDSVEVFDTLAQCWNWRNSPLPRMMSKRSCCSATVATMTSTDGRQRRLIVVTGGASSHRDTALNSCECLEIQSRYPFRPMLPTLHAGVPSRLRSTSLETRASALEEWADEADIALAGFRSCVEETKEGIRAACSVRLATLRRLMAAVERERDGDLATLEEDVRPWVEDITGRARRARQEAVDLRESLRSAAPGVTEDNLSSRRVRGDSSFEGVDDDDFVVDVGETDDDATNENVEQRRRRNGATRSARRAPSASAPSITSSDENGPPHELRCKITGEIMVDPVLAVDGHTYERYAIEEWYSRFPQHEQPRSPTTNERLSSRLLIQNHAIRIQCQSFIQPST